MKVKEIMSTHVIPVTPQSSVSVAARLLQHYNIGALPVCDEAGTLCGIVTDRDLVNRCLASGRVPEKTKIADVMTRQVVCAMPDMEAGVAAHLMGRKQVRRLPVLEQGKLCGMVTVGDLASHEDCSIDVADALGEICNNISERT